LSFTAIEPQHVALPQRHLSKLSKRRIHPFIHIHNHTHTHTQVYPYAMHYALRRQGQQQTNRRHLDKRTLYHGISISLSPCQQYTLSV